MRYFFLALLFGSGLVSAQISDFKSGDPIIAAEMNQNFEYLLGQIESLQSQIDALERGTSGRLTSCAAKDLAGVWVGATTLQSEGYTLFIFGVSSFGALSGEVFTPQGKASVEGNISIDGSCVIDQLRAVADFGNAINGFGALSETGSTMIIAGEDSFGYSFDFVAVKLPAQTSSAATLTLPDFQR